MKFAGQAIISYLSLDRKITQEKIEIFIRFILGVDLMKICQ